MKKLIMVLILICCSLTISAQIKIPNIVNTNPVVLPKPYSVEKLENMKPEEVVLIPALHFNRDLIMALRRYNSWEVSPIKLQDKDLSIQSYSGFYSGSPNPIIGLTVGKNRYVPTIDGLNFLRLKYNPEIGKRYRLIIKLGPGDYRNKKVIIDTNSGTEQFWYINDTFDEIIVDYLGSAQEIAISNLISEEGRPTYQTLIIQKIKLDRVE